MAETHTLTLLEAGIEGTGDSVTFADDLDRVVYVARGDATITDNSLVQRVGTGSGCYARGPLTISAEANGTRVWVWQLNAADARVEMPGSATVKLRQGIELEGTAHIMRLDRVEFPPGAAAHTHVHPGPGIRIVLTGKIGIEQGDSDMKWMSAGEPWFERGPDPVFAPTTEEEPTTFIRCMILPLEWRGRNTIRYVNPADKDKPKLQRYHRFVDAIVHPPGTQ